MEKANLKISVIIPTRNEEKTIAWVINQVKPFADEVLVVDGHSKDKTRDIARKAGARVELDNGKGKGDGLRTAIEKAYGDILVFIDADGSHEASDIPKLVKPIIKGQADLVIGSRMLGGSDEIQGTISNFVRTVGSGIITLIINYRWNVRLTDCENGFRAIRKDIVLNLKLKASDFDIEQEMVTKCLKRGYKIGEVPSHEYERKYGKSNLSVIKKGYKFIWRLIVDLIW